MTLIRKLRTAFSLEMEQYLWLVVVFPLSGLIRLMVLTLPFRSFQQILGHPVNNRQVCSIAKPGKVNRALKLGRTIRIASKYTPWKSNCMVEAVVARLLLVIMNIDHVIFLGARLDSYDEKDMKAHAWLMVGNQFVVGGKGHKAFGIVGTYSSFPEQATLTSEQV